MLVRLLRIQHVEDFLGGTSRFFVVEWARIEWDRPAEEVGRKCPLLLARQRVECLKQWARLTAKNSSLNPPAALTSWIAPDQRHSVYR